MCTTVVCRMSVALVETARFCALGGALALRERFRQLAALRLQESLRQRRLGFKERLQGKIFFSQVTGDIAVRICHRLHHSSLLESVCEFC